jgi:methylglutaconyl-CoA hydratase
VFDADEALRIGLINEVVADATGLAAAQTRIAADILDCAPGAVADAKRLVSDVFAQKIDHGLLEETAKRIAQARVGGEGQEGVRAFLERRRPVWAPGAD